MTSRGAGGSPRTWPCWGRELSAPPGWRAPSSRRGGPRCGSSGPARAAGELLAVAGARALAQGALATAAETLGRAVALLAAGPARAAARSGWVEALALAGRVDEAMAAGAAAIGELTALGETAQ